MPARSSGLRGHRIGLEIWIWRAIELDNNSYLKETLSFLIEMIDYSPDRPTMSQNLP